MIARRVVRGQTLSFPSGSEYRHEARGAVAIGRDGRILWDGALTAVCRRSIAGFRSMTMAIAWSCRGSSMRTFISRNTGCSPHPASTYSIGSTASRSPRKPLREPIPRRPRRRALSRSPVRQRDHLRARLLLRPQGVRRKPLFLAAEARNMAIATGKTMMDRNAVPAVHDAPEQGARDSEKLLVKWHGRGRARYAVTPRFAITSSEAQLRLSGELLKSHPEALLQSHLSESLLEIAAVKRLFPNDTDYTAVYDRFGLLGPNSLFAHGVHLSERECARLHGTGSKVVPLSNLKYVSGLGAFRALPICAKPRAQSASGSPQTSAAAPAIRCWRPWRKPIRWRCFEAHG